MATAILGFFLGWQSIDVSSPSQQTEHHTTRSSAPGSTKASRHTQPTEVLDVDWQPWAKRIGAATSQEALETLFGELLATDDDTLRTTVGPLISARWAEVDPVGGVRYFDSMDGLPPELITLLTEWCILDQNEALSGFRLMGEKKSSQSRTSRHRKRGLDLRNFPRHRSQSIWLFCRAFHNSPSNKRSSRGDCQPVFDKSNTRKFIPKK